MSYVNFEAYYDRPVYPKDPFLGNEEEIQFFEKIGKNVEEQPVDDGTINIFKVSEKSNDKLKNKIKKLKGKK
jgi:hypothetical protein